jgi:hypothetical protein
VVARSWARKAVHTDTIFDTRAVFHAPMFALNAVILNTCAPKPHTVHADGTRSHVSARMRGRQIARARARARTDEARGSVCGGPASATRSSV